MSIEISVVIPFYNSSKYMDLTIDSVLQSTFKDFEIIAVDDCSTDDTYEKLKQYAKKDSRIKIFRMDENHGSAIKCIKYGIYVAKGKYYFYLSHDDILNNTLLENLYNKAIETGADVVVPNLYFIDEKGVNIGKSIMALNNDYEYEVSSREAFLKSLSWRVHGFNLRKIDLIKKIGFDDSYFCADEYFSHIYLFYCNKVVFVDSNFYYRLTKKALTMAFNESHVYFLYKYIMLYEFLENNNFSKSDRKLLSKVVRIGGNKVIKSFLENRNNLSINCKKLIKNILENWHII